MVLLGNLQGIKPVGGNVVLPGHIALALLDIADIAARTVKVVLVPQMPGNGYLPDAQPERLRKREHDRSEGVGFIVVEMPEGIIRLLTLPGDKRSLTGVAHGTVGVDIAQKADEAALEIREVLLRQNPRFDGLADAGEHQGAAGGLHERGAVGHLLMPHSIRILIFEDSRIEILGDLLDLRPAGAVGRIVAQQRHQRHRQPAFATAPIVLGKFAVSQFGDRAGLEDQSCGFVVQEMIKPERIVRRIFDILVIAGHQTRIEEVWRNGERTVYPDAVAEAVLLPVARHKAVGGAVLVDPHIGCIRFDGRTKGIIALPGEEGSRLTANLIVDQAAAFRGNLAGGKVLEDRQKFRFFVLVIAGHDKVGHPAIQARTRIMASFNQLQRLVRDRHGHLMAIDDGFLGTAGGQENTSENQESFHRLQI